MKKNLEALNKHFYSDDSDYFNKPTKANALPHKLANELGIFQSSVVDKINEIIDYLAKESDKE